jgi:threonyl-tRNA synthetase
LLRAQAALPFDRLEVDRAVAMAIFAYSPLKERFLERLPSDARITLYRLGDLVDLCRGPHLPHSGIKDPGHAADPM